MKKHYDFTKSVKNPYARKPKKQITIRLDSETVEYFKALAGNDNFIGSGQHQPTKSVAFPVEPIDLISDKGLGKKARGTPAMFSEPERITRGISPARRTGLRAGSTGGKARRRVATSTPGSGS